MSDKYHDKPEMEASRKLFNMTGITYKWDIKKIIGNNKQIRIYFITIILILILIL